MLKFKDILLVIPARYKSSRFPGKPLKKILGIPMLQRVWNTCIKVLPRKNVIVATDSKKIINFCKEKNINVLLTSKKCLTGSDRIAEIAKKKNFKYFINVQGDEPLVSKNDIKKIILNGLKYKNLIINGYSKIKNIKEFYDLSVPKVIFNKNKNLIYISRSPIPRPKKLENKYAFKQVCIYFFPKSAILFFGKFKKKTPLENVEDIELIRFLENNFIIKMVKLSGSSIAVDYPRHIKEVEKILLKK